MNNKEFQPILRRHINEIKKSESKGWTPISALIIRPDESGLVVYLSSIITLSELQDHLPASYEFVKGHPFIIYDGSERLISDTLSWFGELKSKIGYRLCDDLTYHAELKSRGLKKSKYLALFFMIHLLNDLPSEKADWLKKSW